MAAATQASAPSTVVTEIPGRFGPIYLVDKRGIATQTASTATSQVLAFLPRCESIDISFDTPTQPVAEVGTNFHVSEFDDLPETKVKLTCYDVGYNVISLITNKNAPPASTTTYGFNDFNTAVVDLVQQFADPNGNVFASTYTGDLVVDEFNASLKAKSAAMEDYALEGFNFMKFKGFIVTKAYVVQAGDPAAHACVISGVMGANEGPVALPVPTGSQPPSYWIQRGCLNFLKIERYRASVGWKRFPEIASGVPTAGQCKYTPGTSTLSFNTLGTNDLVAGDVFFLTFCTYLTNALHDALPTPGIVTSVPSTTGGVLPAATTYQYRVTALNNQGETLPGTISVAATTTGTTGSVALSWAAVPSAVAYNVYGRGAAPLFMTTVYTNSFVDTGALTPAGALPGSNTTGYSYSTVPQLSPDTSEVAAVPTRLTPFTISGDNIPRGSAVDIKLMLKRERAEGVGDTDGVWGPSEPPECSINFDVKVTDFALNSVMTTGNITGTEAGGPVLGDFFDPNYMTRLQLSSTVPVVITINDPKNAGAVLKTYTMPTAFFQNLNSNTTSKAAITNKYAGKDRVGNMTIAVTRP